MTIHSKMKFFALSIITRRCSPKLTATSSLASKFPRKRADLPNLLSSIKGKDYFSVLYINFHLFMHSFNWPLQMFSHRVFRLCTAPISIFKDLGSNAVVSEPTSLDFRS